MSADVLLLLLMMMLMVRALFTDTPVVTPTTPYVHPPPHTHTSHRDSRQRGLPHYVDFNTTTLQFCSSYSRRQAKRKRAKAREGHKQKTPPPQQQQQ